MRLNHRLLSDWTMSRFLRVERTGEENVERDSMRFICRKRSKWEIGGNIRALKGKVMQVGGRQTTRGACS